MLPEMENWPFFNDFPNAFTTTNKTAVLAGVAAHVPALAVVVA